MSDIKRKGFMFSNSPLEEEYKSIVTSDYPTCPFCGCQWSEINLNGVNVDEGMPIDIKCNQCKKIFILIKRSIYECMPLTEEQNDTFNKATDKYLKTRKVIDLLEKKEEN